MLRQACFHLCKSPFGTRLVLGAPRGYIHSVPYKLQSFFTQSIVDSHYFHKPDWLYTDMYACQLSQYNIYLLDIICRSHPHICDFYSVSDAVFFKKVMFTYILSVLQITAGKIYPLIQLIPFFFQNFDSIYLI